MAMRCAVVTIGAGASKTSAGGGNNALKSNSSAASRAIAARRPASRARVVGRMAHDGIMRVVHHRCLDETLNPVKPVGREGRRW